MILFRLVAAVFLFLLLAGGADAANRFAVCTTTCTWDGSSTAMWSTSTGGSTGASVPGSTDAVILDANTCVGGTTCTITVNTTVTVQSITMGACTASTTGCILDFSANNNSVTLSAATPFSGTGTGTRKLLMGDNTWTLSNAGAIWDVTDGSNFTLTANNSTITYSNASPAARSFIGGGKTYNILTAVTWSTGAAIAISGAPIITTLTTPNQCNFTFSAGTTTQVGTLTAVGSGASGVFLGSSNTTTAATLQINTAATVRRAALRFLTVTTTAVAASNSLDLGGNSGSGVTFTITGPVTNPIGG